MSRFIVAVDFDGTLSRYDGWRGKGVFGGPVEGAVSACWDLYNDGATLVVWTCRNNESLDIHEWLVEHRFPPFHAVNADLSGLPDRSPKMVADVYIDDRGAGWSGWPDAVAWVKRHRESGHYGCTHKAVAT